MRILENSHTHTGYHHRKKERVVLKDNVLLVKYETYMSTVSYMKAVSLFQCLEKYLHKSSNQ